MQIPIVPSDLRRWALQCIEQANDPRSSGEERERLMKMRESLLALAETQDWLNGRAKSPSGEGHNVHRLGKPRQV